MSHSQGRVTAVLGPTNTGKTHYAIERMLAHRTGVIGLPLRLLAREVYDRIVAVRGPSVVALVTGEERIVPPRTQFWVCTTEAMPHNMGVDFLAVDEIQLCADPERGHVFTDRLLRARGLHETIFMGADTMRGVINALIPDAQFQRRERFSTLSYSGSKKIGRMTPRAAIVGFSVENVYAIAELLRRQKGGAAVVMGALSPRTRNAQVDMYQNGEVDYLVATDAIGMGLNLDINHVAFSGLRKFDGRRMRDLQPNELAQIAGRAGRFQRDGTFGVTGEASPLDDRVVEAITSHSFTPLKKLQWRNSDLEFGSIARLIAALETPPTLEHVVRAREADDQIALKTRRLKQKEALVAEVNDKGEVTVEGQFVGRLEAFQFHQDANATGDEAKTLKTAATAALQPEFHLRADRFYNAPDTEMDFTEQGGLMWGEHAVGKLAAGDDPLKPRVVAFVDEEAGDEVASKVQRRLQHFIDRKIAALFEPLIEIKKDEAMSGMAKGFGFRMIEAMGIIDRRDVADEVKGLDQDARSLLRKHGIRFGQFTIFMPLLLKPAPTRLRQVWGIRLNAVNVKNLQKLRPLTPNRSPRSIPHRLKRRPKKRRQKRLPTRSKKTRPRFFTPLPGAATKTAAPNRKESAKVASQRAKASRARAATGASRAALKRGHRRKTGLTQTTRLRRR